ncbi:MAG: hypothetical protein KBT27_06455, partial [Prevotellaceae bacterium]|nr:hypothetical protein [Candidatus Faecinaster equi]
MTNCDESSIGTILLYQDTMLKSTEFDPDQLKTPIQESEEILKSLGYSQEVETAKKKAKIGNKQWKPSTKISLPDWHSLCLEAGENVSSPVSITQLFTKEELAENSAYIQKLNNDYDNLYKLDNVDWTISAVAGIISGALDILMVGLPSITPNGVNGGTLSSYIRSYFEKHFPPEKMKALGETSFVKTPYDAQDNRNTIIDVEGLSSYYHRALSFGHDPILGFIVGIIDIMTGRMTTLDKNGKLVSQVMECYSDRRETNIFIALSKHILHLKSDITTTMGLPAPFSILFNLCQFGSIGEENKTIAEIAQGMYKEGYDFIQFCASSIPVMVLEVIVRIGWALKRYREGHPLKECIPFSLNREKNPKLATMLFISHSAATAINAGKVAFTKNPMSINYPQWLAFAKYSFHELKWNLYDKPEFRHKYVCNKINSEFDDILNDIMNDYDSYS